MLYLTSCFILLGSYFRPLVLPSLVLMSFDGGTFLFHWEKRRSRKGPSPCSFFPHPFFYLCLLQQMNYLCFFYLESNLCRSPSIFTLQRFASAVITLLYLHFSSPLHHHYCSISHLKEKQKTTLIPLHLHSYFFDPRVAKQYSQIVIILWL